MNVGNQQYIPASEVILVGAGHSHLELIAAYGELSPPPFRLTLISSQPVVPYAGVLTEFIDGSIPWEEAMVDLGHLCHGKNVRFIHSEVKWIDPDERLIYLGRSKRPLTFSTLSIDIGRRNVAHPIDGLQETNVLTTENCTRLIGTIDSMQNTGPARIVTLGLDEHGAELTLALANRLKKQIPGTEFKVFNRGKFLPNLPPKAQQKFREWFGELNIGIEEDPQFSVLKDGNLVASGLEIPCDYVIWGESSGGPELLKNCGVKLSEDGRMLVNNNLESVSHEGIYGGGDCAFLPIPHSISKSGIYGQKLGHCLAQNLFRRYTGHTQLKYQHPKNSVQFFRSKNETMGIFGTKTLVSAFCTNYKASHDTKHFQRYHVASQGAPRIPTFIESGNMAETPCSAAGARLPVDIALTGMRGSFGGAPMSEHIECSDASPNESVLTLPDGTKLFQTTEYLRCFSKDRFGFGKVAAVHCLTPLYARGLAPLSSHLMLTVEFGPKAAMSEEMNVIMDGAAQVLEANKTTQAGIYSQFGLETGFGMMTQAKAKSVWRTDGAKDGDHLILTKPLGSGILFSAHQRFHIDSRQFFCRTGVHVDRT